MAGNFEYYAELGLNAGSAINELSRVSSTADTVTKNLDAMGRALDSVSKRGLKTGAEAKQLRDTLGLYQQLAGAVATYGRSLQTINGTDLNNGVRKTATSLQHMDKALRGVNTVSGDQAKAIKDTLGLYKQLADASAKYASTMKLEADAIKAVASAEKTRQQTAASAARAETRGTGGADVWGVTKDERDQRKRAQVVIQAEREMQAEFERRAQAHLKANRQLARGDQAIRDSADARRMWAKENREAADSGDEFDRSLASTRYALYEVAAAYTATATAALALPVASARVAIEMEAQFAHVERTTQAASTPLAALREEFMDLSTQIPVTFEELSKIGALGAQMGIARQDLGEFADVVAKFSATTNVTVDQASTYFGRLANMMHLTSDDFRQLGSSVSELGTASVSTETEILAVAESIATTANMAGFSADQVVGLSTAMASLRIRPEMARGAMQRIFAKINQAVGEGSDALAEYAQMMGTTNTAVAELWRNDPSQFLMRVSQALGEMTDNVERSTYVRDTLGFTNVRDVELLSRLANGYEVYADSMSLAADAYERGNYLETEAGVIFETTAASLERLANAFKAMLDSLGQSSLGPIKAVAEILIAVLNGVRDIPPAFKGATVGLMTVVGGFAALRAAMALTTASMLAFRMIQNQLAPDGRVTFSTLRAQAAATFPGMARQIDMARGSLAMLRYEVAMAPTVFGKARVAATGLRGALASLGTVGWVGIAVTAASALYAFAASQDAAAASTEQHVQMLQEAMGGTAEIAAALKRDAEELASGVQAEPIAELAHNVETQTRAMRSSEGATTTYVHGFGEMEIGARRATTAIEEQTLAIGKHTDELIRSTLAEYEPPEGVDMANIAEAIERGFDPGQWLQLYYEGGAEAAKAYVEGFNEENNAVQGWGEKQVEDLQNYFSSAGEGLLQALISTEASAAVSNSIGEAFGIVGEEASEAAAEVERLKEEFDSLVGSMFDVVNAESAVQAAFQSLGESIDENGTDFSVMTEAGRANMDAFEATVEAMAKNIEQQVASGVLSAEEGANQFATEYTALVDGLAALGVDPSQFDMFHDHINALFADDIVVGVDISGAVSELLSLSELAANVLGNIASSAGDSALGGLASWGQGVAERYNTRVLPRWGSENSSNRAAWTNQQYQRSQQQAAAAARVQAVEAARARAEQQRLAEEAERAAKEAERQADEQKRAAEEAKKLREQIAEASDEGRIFEEIIKGLGTAFAETLHEFNQFQAARDSLEQRLITMRDAAQASADEVRTLREEYAKLKREAAEDTTDARQAESFAAVARQYGDTERATDYSQQAEEARASAREKERLAAEAYAESRALEKNRLSLTGYSEQAIKNRESVRALQQEMSDMIIAYAETGATTQEVTAYAEALRRKFVDQLIQMGYNRQDVMRLSEVFIELKADIERVPREVRIKARAEVAEAEAALREVARGRTATIDIKPKQESLTLDGALNVRSVNVTDQIKANRIEATNNFEYGNGVTSNWRRAGGGLIPGPSTGPTNRDNRIVIGPNGPEGSVRTGEWVVPKPAVDAIGIPALQALSAMSPGARFSSSAPAVNAGRTGIQLVEILPHQISQIAQAVSTVLAVDGKVLAGTTNAQNTQAARRGTR